jgi:Mn-dependent DtxR family transcriptional regulator
MARHFDLPHEQLHATAERIEHFLSLDLQAELAAELNQPSIDPQGKSIPSEAD